MYGASKLIWLSAIIFQLPMSDSSRGQYSGIKPPLSCHEAALAVASLPFA